MRRLTTVSEIRPIVRSTRSLMAGGWRHRDIAGAVRDGTLDVVRRGWFMAAQDASALWSEGRHLAHVIAVARDMTGTAVVSHESAGVLWGLPLYRHRPRRVHLTTRSPSRVSSGADVLRHVAPLGAEDVVVRDGIRCTSLARTVFDMTRTLPAEASVACADAAERIMMLRGREWDEDARAAWRRSMCDRIKDSARARGIRQARWVTVFANGRAQLPGESVSRLQLARIGFPAPELQVPVSAPGGRTYHVDFGLRGVRAWGEFDGKGKYLDEAMRRDVPLEQVLLEEKQREDWIRGLTQWRFARWSEEHSATPQALAARLASFSIHPPR